MLGSLCKTLMRNACDLTRGRETFSEWNASLVRNSDYVCLCNDARLDFLEGEVVYSDDRRIRTSEFKDYLHVLQIPHSHAVGYRFSDTGEDYLVGALARINLDRHLHPRTKADTEYVLSALPSNNIYNNNLAQAIEVP